MRSGSRVGLLVFVGALLLQAAWILAVPPFRGIDEFDHAYRAAAVAQGEWIAHPAAGDAMVMVPLHIIDAANPVCASMPYTGLEDCAAQTLLPDGRGAVVSGAARYNPVFYWLIGTLADPFTGYTALYVMRIVTAILCAAFLGMAAAAAAISSRAGWALVGPLVAATPVAIYSGSIAAPNGVEIGAAMLVWCALLGMSRGDLTASRQRTLVWLSVIGALPLVTVRALGPLWLALLVLTVLMMVGGRQAINTCKRTPRTIMAASAIVLVGTLMAAAWTRSQNALQLRVGDGIDGDPVAGAVSQIPLWIFQSIAAFPTRNEQAPAVVYACSALVGLALVVSAFRYASNAQRMAIGLGIALTIAVPFWITVTTWHEYGAAWQGRYTLPYSMGVLLIAAHALDVRGWRPRMLGFALLCGGVLLTIAQATSAVRVLLLERIYSPLAGTSAWWIPSPWLIAALVVVGAFLWGLALKRSLFGQHAAPSEDSFERLSLQGMSRIHMKDSAQ